MIRISPFASIVLLLLAALPAGVATAAPGGSPDRGPAQELARLRASAPGAVEAEPTPDRRHIRTLRGSLTAPSPEAARTIAVRFLSENAALFGFAPDLSDLRSAGSSESPGGRHLRFAQYYRGLPVFDRGLEVHLARDGSVFLVRNDFAPGVRIPVTPSRRQDEAAGVAIDAFLAAAGSTMARPQLERAIVPELGVVADQGAPRLAWRLVVSATEPWGVAEFLIDAQTGEVLGRKSLVQDSHLTGRGQVFDPNPVNTLSNTGLSDNDNADAPVFGPAYRTIDLPGLSRSFLDLLGPIVLSGPYIRVTDLIERPFLPMVSSATGDFLFTRDRPEFESVMVYFHIDQSQRYIQSLGFTDVNNRPIRVDPHGLNGADNSHYVGLPLGAGWIAFGEGGVDDAEDADVIRHEYGHAIQDNTTSGKYFGLGESGAQGEGFGDYWAFSNGPTSPESFDPACLGEWDFAGTCLRRLDSSKHYPEDVQREVHADGEIWSSALHAIFLAVGKRTADTVILQSHFLVPFAPRFCDGGRALLDADGLLYGGAERPAIGTALAERGIASDLAPQDPVASPDGQGADAVTFAIANLGPCTAGAAAHALVAVCPGADPVDLAVVRTDALLPGDRASFAITNGTLAAGCFYRVVADASGDEPETDEGNNALDAPPITS